MSTPPGTARLDEIERRLTALERRIGALERLPAELQQVEELVGRLKLEVEEMREA